MKLWHSAITTISNDKKLRTAHLWREPSSCAFIGSRPPSKTMTGVTLQLRSSRIRSMQNAMYLQP